MAVALRVKKVPALLNGILILSPFINNINGFFLITTGISFIGPLFYSTVLLACLALLLFSRSRIQHRLKNAFALVCVIYYVIICVLTGRLALGDLPSVLKVVSPLVIYLALITLIQDHTIKDMKDSIRDAVVISVVIYSLFVLASAIIGKNITAGEGYYGFVHGNNDLVAMFLLCIPVMAGAIQGGSKLGRLKSILYFIALMLTKSKALLISPMMVFHPHKKRYLLILVPIVAGLAYYAYVYYSRLFASFGFAVTFENVWTFMSFGRAKFMDLAIESFKVRGILDNLIGSGIDGARLNIGGKDGVEMDPIDVFNIYGMVGLLFYGYFYFWMLMKFARSRRKKLMFAPFLLYSIFGGHLFVNPIVNNVFPFILLLVRNEDA